MIGCREANGSSRKRCWARVVWGAFLAAACNIPPETAVADELDDARTLFRAGKYAECIEACTAGLEREDWRENWRLLKIQAELETGQYGQARRTLEAALQSFEASIALRLIGRQVYRFNDRPDLGDRLLDEIEKLTQERSFRFTDATNRIALGRFFLLRGADPRQVLETFYDPVRRDRPELIDVHIATGELALEKHDDALAAESFALAAKYTPDDPAVLYRLARAYVESDSQKAEEALARALRANPRHTDSLLLQADSLIDAEDYIQAKQVLAKVLEVNPAHPRGCALMAVLAHLDADEKGEQEWRAKALAHWSTNPEVDHLIGRKLSAKYRFAEGAGYQRQSLAFDSGYLPARIQLSNDLLRLGDDEEGWRLASEVHRDDGYDVLAYNLVTLRESLSKFATLTGDGIVLRMEPREAELYGPSALELLQRARQTLAAKYDIRIEEPVVVEIFHEQKDFAVRTFGMPGVAGFLGVCFGSVITANSPASQGENPANWQSVLWHEFCHTVTLHKTKNRMPRWLSEGISVYEERQANPTWGQPMNGGYRRMILDGKLTPVSRLSGAFLNIESPADLEFAYFESSLVVEYLVEKHGLPVLKQMLDDLARGTPINDVLASRVAPLDKLDEQFAAYARQQAERFAPEVDWAEPPLPPNSGLEAVRAFAKKNPKNIAGLALLARKLLESRLWVEAKAPLERLLEIYPENVDGDNAYLALARVQRELGDTAGERDTLERLAARDGDAREAYLRLIEIGRQASDWKLVADNAERMLAVNPLLEAPHRALAEAAEALGDAPRAIRGYQAVLSFDPVDLAEVHHRLGRMLRETGDLAGAKRQVLMALEEAPRFRAAHQTLLELVEPEPQ